MIISGWRQISAFGSGAVCHSRCSRPEAVRSLVNQSAPSYYVPFSFEAARQHQCLEHIVTASVEILCSTCFDLFARKEGGTP